MSSPLPGPPAGPLQQITFVSLARPQAHSCVPVAAQSGTLGKGHNVLAVGSLLKDLTGTFCPKWSGPRSKPHELHIKRGELSLGAVVGRVALREQKKTVISKLFLPRSRWDQPCPETWGEALRRGKQASRPPEAAPQWFRTQLCRQKPAALTATGWAALGN